MSKVSTQQRYISSEKRWLAHICKQPPLRIGRLYND